MTVPRFKIVPRDVPASAVARLLGVSEARFVDCVSDLLARGFPGPDATTGNYDPKAVEGAGSPLRPERHDGCADGKDASAVIAVRLAAMRNG